MIGQGKLEKLTRENLLEPVGGVAAESMSDPSDQIEVEALLGK